MPVIPASLHERVFLSAHVNTGHGNSEVTWDSIRKRGFFPNAKSTFGPVVHVVQLIHLEVKSRVLLPMIFQLARGTLCKSIRWSWARSKAAHNSVC